MCMGHVSMSERGPSPAGRVNPEETEIRVFVSSTFRDMQEEREQLMRRVAPQLRHMASERGVALSLIDLRWGIPPEQAERGRVVPICFRGSNLGGTRPRCEAICASGVRDLPWYCSGSLAIAGSTGHAMANSRHWAQEAPSSALLEPGQSFGAYEIVRCVGVGGMGAVYEAVHRVLGKPVAVKVLHPQHRASEAQRLRFRREGEMAARIRHPHVVDIVDVGVEGDICYIVMEFLTGESLAAVIDREGRLDLQRALAIVVDVASGLTAVHDQGIIHRDLKPENIFLAVEGEHVVAKIIDFGVSKDLLESIGRANTVAGTATHMAPEQARGDSVDGRADEYALAVILYEALTGRLPYNWGSLLEILQHQEGVKPFSLRDSRSDVPIDLEKVVFRALDLDPHSRFATVAEFGAALQGFEDLA